MKKRILLLTTGGTIASVPGGEGLEPHPSGVMDRELEQLGTYYAITVKDVMCLDSSNIHPRQWQELATEIFRLRHSYDGIENNRAYAHYARRRLDEAGYTGSCGLEYRPTLEPEESLKEFRRIYLGE